MIFDDNLLGSARSAALLPADHPASSRFAHEATSRRWLWWNRNVSLGRILLLRGGHWTQNSSTPSGDELFPPSVDTAVCARDDVAFAPVAAFRRRLSQRVNSTLSCPLGSAT
jgi:hypothetical protein